MNGDDFWRRRMESDRVLRRWSLRRLVKELANPGKRQHALREAERRFDVTSAEDLQALLDAMPQPRTTTKRGQKGRLRRMLREQDIDPWSGTQQRGRTPLIEDGPVATGSRKPELTPLVTSALVAANETKRRLQCLNTPICRLRS